MTRLYQRLRSKDLRISNASADCQLERGQEEEKRVATFCFGHLHVLHAARNQPTPSLSRSPLDPLKLLPTQTTLPGPSPSSTPIHYRDIHQSHAPLRLVLPSPAGNIPPARQSASLDPSSDAQPLALRHPPSRPTNHARQTKLLWPLQALQSRRRVRRRHPWRRRVSRSTGIVVDARNSAPSFNVSVSVLVNGHGLSGSACARAV